MNELNKIPDSMLPKFTCSKCNCYVTMAPIFVESDGQISCGSCTDLKLPKVRCNLLESLATLYAFPCRYKNSGCSEYMNFNRTHQHESLCDYHTFRCPFGAAYNTCKWEGAAVNMFEHYKEQHSHFSTTYNQFKITLEDEYEKYYMTEICNMVFLLQMKSSVAHEKLWFNAIYIGEPKNVNFIKFRLKITCKNVSAQELDLPFRIVSSMDTLKMDTDKSVMITKRALREVWEGATYIHCNWMIQVYTQSDEIVKIDSDDDNSDVDDTNLVQVSSMNTTCPNCNVLMVAPIFRCANSEMHVTCIDCKGYYNECKQCQKNGVIFKKAEDLEKISKLKFYKCRWSNCNEVKTFQNIRVHENECKDRIYKCPKCNIWSGDSETLFVHFKITHAKYKISRANPLIFNCRRFTPGYILTHNELFLLEIDVDFRRRLNSFSVTYLGLASQFKHWKCSMFSVNGKPIPILGYEANVIFYQPQPGQFTSYRLIIERETLKIEQ